MKTLLNLFFLLNVAMMIASAAIKRDAIMASTDGVRDWSTDCAQWKALDNMKVMPGSFAKTGSPLGNAQTWSGHIFQGAGSTELKVSFDRKGVIDLSTTPGGKGGLPKPSSLLVEFIPVGGAKVNGRPIWQIDGSLSDHCVISSDYKTDPGKALTFNDIKVWQPAH